MNITYFNDHAAKAVQISTILCRQYFLIGGILEVENFLD